MELNLDIGLYVNVRKDEPLWGVLTNAETGKSVIQQSCRNVKYLTSLKGLQNYVRRVGEYTFVLLIFRDRGEVILYPDFENLELSLVWSSPDVVQYIAKPSFSTRLIDLPFDSPAPNELKGREREQVRQYQQAIRDLGIIVRQLYRDIFGLLSLYRVGQELLEREEIDFVWHLDDRLKDIVEQSANLLRIDD